MGPLSAAELQAGLVAGGGAALLILAYLWLRHRMAPTDRPAEPWPYGGMVGVVAGLIVVRAIGPMPWELVVVAIGVTAAIDLVHVSGRSWWVGVVAALPFACFLATADGIPERLWYQALVIVGVVAGSVLAAATDVDWRAEAAGPVLLAISVAGVYAAVPDTEVALGILGVALWLAVLAWPWPLVRLGAGGGAGMATLLVWSAADGARGRPASFIGALACFGLLALLPLGARLGRDLPDVLDGVGPRMRTVLVGIVQLAVVLLAARTSGLQSSIPKAVALAVPPLAVGFVAACAFRPRRSAPLDVPRPVQPLRGAASTDD